MVWRTWGDGPALVLLHGGSGSWTHWVRNIAHFERDYRIIAGDLPGLGDSPDPRAPYSVDSLADIVSNGIDQLVPADAPFDLVGFSFGGILCGHIAHRQRQRITSVTIVGSPAFGMGSTGPANAVKSVPKSLSFTQALSLHRYNLQTLMFSNPASIDALSLIVHHDNLHRARLRSRKIARTDTLAKALPHVTCRVHGIWGGNDVTVHPSLEALRTLFLDARPGNAFDVLPGGGHWIAFEHAQWFNETLEKRLTVSRCH